MFRDRYHAGRALGERLSEYAQNPDVIVLGLPRGGVVVASEVARRLGVELDVFFVRKLGVPEREELAFGAISVGGVKVVNDQLVKALDITPEQTARVIARESQELERQIQVFRGDRTPPRLEDRMVILVDDGLATGATMKAAIDAVRYFRPRRVIVAVPVAPQDTCSELARVADDVVCLATPEPFYGVGMWYEDFSEVADQTVRDLLDRGRKQSSLGEQQSNQPRPAPVGVGNQGRVGSGNMDSLAKSSVRIPIGRDFLVGDLSIPAGAQAIVLFAHGSGSSRLSPRNRWVAAKFNEQGLATLLMDLLTQEEEAIDQRTMQLRFNIPLLAGRLEAAAQWLAGHPDTRHLRIGAFGASTGAAAALIAAARLPQYIRAVVSRGGRPDLAGEHLGKVQAPTLLIVGSRDEQVVELNQAAFEKLRCVKSLELVPGATHLFEEPGALKEVARLASEWFMLHVVHAEPAGAT